MLSNFKVQAFRTGLQFIVHDQERDFPAVCSAARRWSRTEGIRIEDGDNVVFAV